MLSKVSKLLMQEHENILEVIESLEDEIEKLKDNQQINRSLFLEIIDFIKNYADKFHHAKEEDVLFAEFNKEEENMHCNPVPQMLHEHDEGRNFVKAMLYAVESNNKDQLIENSLNYAGLLREHIYKEDNILYPMIDEGLNKKTLELIYKKFLKIELEKKKDKQKYLNFLKGLKTKK
jgi:hemerythrin-like domain-containing protein